MANFELEWFGGAAAKHFRKLRPGVEEMPWGTLRPADYPPMLVERARRSWTEAAYNEYCTGVAFAGLLQSLLEAQAPIDLVGMASDFVADELVHVELTSRMAMALGGGAPREVDFTAIAPRISSSLSPLAQANERIVQLCCVGEAFSVPLLAGNMRTSSHPLTRAVLEMIVKDEAPHGRLGWLYLEWVADELDDAERRRLARVAVDTLRLYAPMWRRLRSVVTDGVTSEGYRLADVTALGWMESQSYAAAARDAVRDEVVAPLAKFGIELDAADVAALVDAET